MGMGVAALATLVADSRARVGGSVGAAVIGGVRSSVARAAVVQSMLARRVIAARPSFTPTGVDEMLMYHVALWAAGLLW